MSLAMSDERLNNQWKIDEIILEALQDLDLSEQEAREEFERIRVLDEKQIEEELANLEGEEEEFDPLQYVASNPDLIETIGADEEAAERHWEEIGEEEGREFDDFDVEQYLENYPDLQAAFGDDVEDDAVVDAATLHYIQTGYFEGRNYEGPDEEGLMKKAPTTEPLMVKGPKVSRSRVRRLLGQPRWKWRQTKKIPSFEGARPRPRPTSVQLAAGFPWHALDSLALCLLGGRCTPAIWGRDGFGSDLARQGGLGQSAQGVSFEKAVA